MEKENLRDYTLSSLLELEKALRIICVKYESVSKNYDGSIINNDQYALFKKYNDFRGKVVDEMEKILNGLIDSVNG